MSLTQKGIVSGFMFILFNSLCPKNDISFEDQEVEKGHSISPLSKLSKKIQKQGFHNED